MLLVTQGLFYSVVKETENDLLNKIGKSEKKMLLKNDQAIQCELCYYWIPLNCNNFNYIDYKFLQSSNWYCILCCSEIFPFNSMKGNKNFSMCVSNFHNNNKPVKTLSNESSLLLKPSENLKPLENQFKNLNIMILMNFKI